MIFVPNFALLFNAYNNWHGYEKKNRFIKESDFVSQNIKNNFVDINIYQKIEKIGENKIFIKAKVLNKNNIPQEGKFKFKLIRPLDYTLNKVYVANYDGKHYFTTIILPKKGQWKIISHFQNSNYNYKTVQKHFNK